MSARAAYMIKMVLLAEGPLSIWDVWKRLRQLGYRYKYDTIAKYMRILRSLGLVEIVGTAPCKFGCTEDRKLHAVVREHVNHPCWEKPRECYEQLQLAIFF